MILLHEHAIFLNTREASSFFFHLEQNALNIWDQIAFWNISEPFFFFKKKGTFDEKSPLVWNTWKELL
jgi:hypothetical protein